MKVTSLEVVNVLGVKEVNLELSTPITVIAGGNYAGKSSLAESIRMVFGEKPVRVDLKGEYKKLVHEGEKKGIASLTIDGHEDPFMVSLPKGDTNADFSDKPALPFVLDPSRFAKLKDAERRSLLFGLTGIRLSREHVKGKMIERGCDPEKVDSALPYLKGGFSQAVEYAESMLKDCRGAWRGVTGEVYGSLKAEGWKAEVLGERPSEEEIDSARQSSLNLEGALSKETQALGELRAKAAAWEQWKQENTGQAKAAEELEALLNQQEALEENIAKIHAELVEAESLAGGAAREGLIHDLARALCSLIDSLGEVAIPDEVLHAIERYEDDYGRISDEGDIEAAKRVKEFEVSLKDLEQKKALLDKQVDRARKSASIGGEPEKVTIDEVQAQEVEVGHIRKAKAEIDQAVAELTEAARLHDSASAKTAQAAKHHADVTQWSLIKEALSPDGIPGEAMGEALQKVNQRLEQSSDDSEWPKVSIDADMIITYGGREYQLCSESERYRADLMLAEMISHLSGLKFLLIDAFDILEVSARTELLEWLDILATEGEVETVIALATLVDKPQGLPETFSARYMVNGKLV